MPKHQVVVATLLAVGMPFPIWLNRDGQRSALPISTELRRHAMP